MKKFRIIALLCGGLISQACMNIHQTQSLLATVNNPAFLNSDANGIFTHTLNNVAITALPASPGSGTPNLELSLSVDSSGSFFQPLTGFCGINGVNPCVCELQWTEVNSTNGSNTSYSRTKRLPVLSRESGVVKCQILQTGSGSWDEIANATVISMNIVALPANITGLKAKSINYKKGTSLNANGDFLDDTLTPFRNIHRYACFTKHTTSHEILNQYFPAPAPSPAAGGGGSAQPSNLILGSRFCSSATSVSGQGKCANPRNGYSAQSYYRNFYIRSDKTGEINSTNNTFDCPKVLESLAISAGQTDLPGKSGQYWPLDATFSLATTYSPDWNVGVRAASVLLKVGDPNSVQDACVNEDQTQRLIEAGTVTKCMGYAKKPKVDGTCGTLKDNNGRIRPLTRLRRYRVIYPPVFLPSGDISPGHPFADEIYVADRLVVDANGVATGSMIYGPKPCNYAWYDHEGVVKRDGPKDFSSGFSGNSTGQFAQPGYVATSRYFFTDHWSVNPDGLVFPNVDRDGGVSNANDYASCAATLPVVDTFGNLGAPSLMHLQTTHNSRLDYLRAGPRKFQLSEVHIQPIDPWIPNYLEDTAFQACAPVADPYLEPPLHFYKKDSNTIAWCSEPYPTQNPYWYQINQSVKLKNPSTTFSSNLVNYPTLALVPIMTSHATFPDPLTASTPQPLDALYNNLNSGCTGTTSTILCPMTTVTAPDNASCKNYLSSRDNYGATVPVTPRQTCDRTVTFDSNQAYFGFPLQAADTDIETMLSNQSDSFSCHYSVNADPNKVNKKTPSSGCCGMISGARILDSLVTGVAGAVGHLEPFKNPSAPNIRFCGSPVE